MSFEVEDLDLREFINLNLNCIHFFGYFWPELRKMSKLSRTIYCIFASIFVFVAYILSVLSQVIDMINSFGDLEQMTDASFLLLTNFVQIVKITCFNIYRKKVFAFKESMNRPAFKPKNSKQREIISEEIYVSKRNTIGFFVACTFTCASWAISPLIDSTNVDGWMLPLRGWYPFNTRASPGFQIAYIYQCFVTWFGGIGNISMDTFMAGSIMVISAQLNVLNQSFENINKSKSVEDLKKDLVESVHLHRNILDYAEDFTFLFTVSITGMFVVGVITVCVSLFQMSLVPVLSFRFLAMFLYQACVFAEIYLWCFYGNEVILKSDKLTKSAYLCEWIDAPKEFKTDLIFFMTRTQYPLKLYASGYFALSLETFKAIVKSSWSYFAVLHRVHSQDTEF